MYQAGNYTRPYIRLFLTAAFICFLTIKYAFGMQSKTETPLELFRLRIQNLTYGSIEISSDEGKNYDLIGRVMTPATAPDLDRSFRIPGRVERASAAGIAFSFGKNEILRLLPAIQASAGKKKSIIGQLQKNVLQTNIPQGSSIFAGLAPTVGTRVQLQYENDALKPVEENSVINDEDALVFAVMAVPPTGGALGSTREERTVQIRKTAETAVSEYASTTLSRAASIGLPIVSGNMTLKARTAAGEPEPVVAVSYLVDNNVVYAQNTAPFEHILDSHELKDGEHVVEIRGFDKKGNPVSRKRSLVVVHNRT